MKKERLNLVEKENLNHMPCRCSEAYFERDTIVERIFPAKDQKHDCQYIELRNALIPMAEGIADDEMREIAKVKGITHAQAGWSRLFMQAMDELVKVKMC